MTKIQITPKWSEVKPEGYYVYLHRRATDGSVFYVGKGKGRRAWVVRGRSRHWTNVSRKNGVLVDVSQSEISESDAFLLEAWLIAKFRNQGLEIINLTDGGEGASGQQKSDIEREAISKRMTGKAVSDETKLKLSKSDEYVFVHDEFGERKCTQYEMFLSGYLTKTAACSLVKGRRKQAKGWRIEGVIPRSRSGRDNGMYDSNTYHFRHDDHGDLMCRRSELIEWYGLLDSKVSCVINGARKSHKGWRLIGRVP